MSAARFATHSWLAATSHDATDAGFAVVLETVVVPRPIVVVLTLGGSGVFFDARAELCRELDPHPLTAIAKAASESSSTTRMPNGPDPIRGHASNRPRRPVRSRGSCA